MPLVRVIVPTFNRSALVREALATVRAQTFADFEAVVVDDGSTDDTPEVLAALAAEDPRIRPLRQANAGPAAARNTAVTAPGAFTYVALIDSDDRWLPTHLERAVALLESAPDVAVAFGRSRVNDETGRYDPERIRQREDVSTALDCATRHVGAAAHVLDVDRFARLVVRDEFYPHPSTLVVRAAAVRHRPWFDVDVFGWEDVDFYLSMASARATFALDDHDHAVVGFQGDNVTGCADLSSPRTLRNWESVLRVCRKKVRLARSREDRDVARRNVAQWAYLVGQAQAEQGRRADARRSYLEAVRARPTRLAVRALAGASVPARWTALLRAHRQGAAS